MNKLLATLLVAGLSTSAVAKQKTVTDEQILANWDEAQAITQSAGSIYPRGMCFVDTPAWDNYSYERCGAAGSARTTSMVCTVDGSTLGNFSVNWSDSRCSSSSKTCMLPIRWGETIALSGTLVDHAIGGGIGYNFSCTGSYFGLF